MDAHYRANWSHFQSAGTVKGLPYRCCLKCWDSQRAVIQELSHNGGQSKGCHTGAVSHAGTVKGLSYRCRLTCWDSQRLSYRCCLTCWDSQGLSYRCCLKCWDSQRAVIQVLSHMLGQSKGCHTGAISYFQQSTCHTHTVSHSDTLSRGSQTARNCIIWICQSMVRELCDKMRYSLRTVSRGGV